MAARSAGLKPSSFQFSSLWSSSSVSPALRPPGRLAAIQKAHWLAKDVARYTIALVRRSTKPGPISAALNGMKFLSAAGRRASFVVLDALNPIRTLSFLRHKILHIHLTNVNDNLPDEEIARRDGRLYLVQVRAFL